MDKIFLRAFTKLKNNKKSKSVLKEKYREHKIVFVFDTETTTDLRQNLKVGYFQIYINESLVHRGLFYKEISKSEMKIISDYAKNNKMEIYSHEEFIKMIFYPIVFQQKALCVGFNLPFDITNISIANSSARRNELGGFSFTFSNDIGFPRIKIKHLTSDSQIIKFSYSPYNKDKFQGYFLDTQKLASILLEIKKISLKRACKELKTKTQKLDTEEHGKITPEYLDYLLKDVRATYEVYLKLKEEYEKYQVDLAINKISSGASLGKTSLRQMGIKPFMETNPDFPNWLIGATLSTYYGGRTECKIRHLPTKVTTLDFKSMYPTITLLMNLWNYLIAKKIDYKYCTQETQELLDNIKLEDVVKPEIWGSLQVLVEIIPDEDILPVRTNYDPKSKMHTIGINKLTINKKIWYALPDIIASKILSGKSPKVIRAIKFIPIGKQDSLKKTSLLGSEINPSNENFIKKLVEERQKVKESNPQKAQALKIIVNATSYGIFIQLDPEEKKEEVDVYSNENFSSSECVYEKPGEFFNPLVGVLITSGARLLLAMAELFTKNKGFNHAYMDTDSCFIPPEIAEELSSFFQKLNPYEINMPLLKIEKRNKWFYGISSKRYVLYDLKGKEIVIDPDRDRGDYKLHGLGHIKNPFRSKDDNWHDQIWKDILSLHYGYISEREVAEKYSKFFVISQLTISNPYILNWFKKIKEVRPYGFYLRGIGAKNNVKPISPYRDDSQSIVYEPFNNLGSGEVMQGEEYWKTLDKEILNYINHPESKFQGKIGLLERRHLKPNEIIYIGKESNEIGEELIKECHTEKYFDEKKLRDKILVMKPEEARKLGIKHRSTLKRIKDRIKTGKKIKINSRFLHKLLS